MKALFMMIAISLSAQTLAQTIKFNGYVREAMYPQMMGLKCSLELTEATPSMIDKFPAYIAKPKIRDYSPFFSNLAPISKFRVSLDLSMNDIVLSGVGSRKWFDKSQTIYVTMTNASTIQTWTYIDTTRSTTEPLYTCAK